MRKDRSPEPPDGTSENSSRPIRERFFSTKSATCLLNMQAKLLRVLEEGEVERIGGDKPIAVNVRVVVATHRDLEARVREEKFRQDLFHRIYVFPLAAAAAARAARRHSGSGAAFRGASVRAEWMEASSLHRRGDGGVAIAFVAGECSRVAQHGRAADAACDRRSG